MWWQKVGERQTKKSQHACTASEPYISDAERPGGQLALWYTNRYHLSPIDICPELLLDLTQETLISGATEACRAGSVSPHPPHQLNSSTPPVPCHYLPDYSYLPPPLPPSLSLSGQSILSLPPSLSSVFIICVYDGGGKHPTPRMETLHSLVESGLSSRLYIGSRDQIHLAADLLSLPLPSLPRTLRIVAQQAGLWLYLPPQSIQAPHDHGRLCFPRKL